MQRVEGAIVQVRGTAVQIDPRGWHAGRADGRQGSVVRIRMDEQIDVAIGPQSGVRIQSRDRPALSEDGLDSAVEQKAEERGQRLIVNRRLQGGEAVRVLKITKVVNADTASE